MTSKGETTLNRVARGPLTEVILIFLKAYIHTQILNTERFLYNLGGF